MARKCLATSSNGIHADIAILESRPFPSIADNRDFGYPPVRHIGAPGERLRLQQGVSQQFGRRFEQLAAGGAMGARHVPRMSLPIGA